MTKSWERKAASRAAAATTTAAADAHSARLATSAWSTNPRAPLVKPSRVAKAASARAARSAPAPTSARTIRLNLGLGRGRREAGGALGQQGAGVEHAVRLQASLDHDLDPGLEDVGQLAPVVDRHARPGIAGGELHLQPAVQPLYVVLHRSQHPRLSHPGVGAELGDGAVVLRVAGRRAVDQVPDAGGQHGRQHPPAKDHRGASAFSAASVSIGSLPGTLRATDTSSTPTFESSSSRSRHSAAGPMMVTRSTISSLITPIA